MSFHCETFKQLNVFCVTFLRDIFFDMLRFILEQCFIGKNAMSLCEVDDIVELIPARRVGLTTFFFQPRCPPWEPHLIERTSIKRGLTNLFFIEARCKP
jgi:hypothetical protein